MLPIVARRKRSREKTDISSGAAPGRKHSKTRTVVMKEAELASSNVAEKSETGCGSWKSGEALKRSVT